MTSDAIKSGIEKAVAARKPLSKNLIVRVSADLHDKLAALADQMTETLPGRRTTVSDVARVILEQGLRDKRKIRRVRDDWGLNRYQDEPEQEEGI
jgi:hypothetical protein